MAKTKKQIGKDTPKNIVYLIGAGATQAEVHFLGGVKINLSMRRSETGEGLSARILQRSKVLRSLNLSDENYEEIDIEKLISLLAASGIEQYRKDAEELRTLYFEELLDGLIKSKILDNPILTMSLFEMYNKTQFAANIERLSGIITLNHDNLCQVASQHIFGGLNLGFKFETQKFFKCNGKKTVPVIQMHGAFNWTWGVPIRVNLLNKQSRYGKEMIWIPPTTLKEAKDYPYNKLMGIAYEILSKHCDILRVIGCSLSQNDWNIHSLLFNAQYHQLKNRGDCFKIELIMPQKAGDYIQKEYAYLQNMIPIGYLTEGGFARYKDESVAIVDSELKNPFKFWLKEKMKYHINRKEFKTTQIGKALKAILI